MSQAEREVKRKARDLAQHQRNVAQLAAVRPKATVMVVKGALLNYGKYQPKRT